MRRALLFGAGLIVLWGALQLLPARPAPSAPDAGPIQEAAGPRPGNRPMYGPGLLGVVAVLAALGGGAWILHQRRGAGVEADVPRLASVGQLTLGTGQQLRLVSCGDEVLLLGVTSGQISLLKSFDAAAFAADAHVAGSAAATPSPSTPATVPAADPAPADFASVLHRFKAFHDAQPAGTPS